MMSLAPTSALLDRADFVTWLETQGSQILASTNQWEVLRYRCGNVTSIVYRNKNGRLTWTGESSADYRKYKTLAAGIAPMNQAKRRKVRAKLLKRDGPLCWLCGEFLPTGPVHPHCADSPTIEHLVPQSEGGGHTLANLVLAHQDCNGRADNAPLADKIEMRAGLLALHATVPPWESVRITQ